MSIIADQRNHRQQQIKSRLASHQAVLVTQVSDVAYLTGLTNLNHSEREGWLIIFPRQSYLIHSHFAPLSDELRQPQAVNLKLLTGLSLAQLSRHLTEIIIPENPDLKELLIDVDDLKVSEWQMLSKFTQLQLKNWDRSQMWRLRAIKNQEELVHLLRASSVTSQVAKKIRHRLQLGQTERQVKAMIDRLLIKKGGDRSAFPTIVAFGDHTALPHHQPTDRVLTLNTPVLVDYGALVEGYASDLTRSWWFGPQPDPEYQQIARVVKQAYQAGLSFLVNCFDGRSKNTGKSDSTNSNARPFSLTAQQLDEVVRQVIDRAGWGEAFIHTTGHGLGLDIHEPPSINQHNQQPLQTNMVITIEPGIYLSGKFGYRYENTIGIFERVVELTNSS